MAVGLVVMNVNVHVRILSRVGIRKNPLPSVQSYLRRPLGYPVEPLGV
jgi:hypothetical protein